MEETKQFKDGMKLGVRLMMERIKLAAEHGNPIEIDGRAYYVKGDLEHLKEIMENIG